MAQLAVSPTSGSASALAGSRTTRSTYGPRASDPCDQTCGPVLGDCFIYSSIVSKARCSARQPTLFAAITGDREDGPRMVPRVQLDGRDGTFTGRALRFGLRPSGPIA